MKTGSIAQRYGHHQNAFGLLRLLLASAVIIGHVPEIIDGNRSREPLTLIFHTFSLGELAVDCFFIISGYLIVGSYLKTPDPRSYLRKRIARIYPGFVVASLVCILIVAPIAGGTIHTARATGGSLLAIATLGQPFVKGTFDGMHYPILNGAMWTISYEFRCYLLVAALGWLGWLQRPRLIGGLVVGCFLCLAMIAVTPHADARSWIEWGAGRSINVLRLTACFFTGSIFYLKRDRIRFTRARVAGSVVALGIGLCNHQLAAPAVATFGSYLIFAFAMWGRYGILNRINNRTDISYGIYLYGWPLTMLIVRFFPALPVALVAMLAVAAACLCGWLSWTYVEKPCLRFLSDRGGDQLGRRLSRKFLLARGRSSLPAN